MNAATTESGRPAWPPWYGLAALGMALVMAIMAGAILLAIVKGAGADVDADSSGITLGATLIQDIALVGSALWLAAHIARPQAWQFGLRGTPFWRGVKWAAIAFAIYFTFQLIYAAAVHPDEKQTTLQDLGAGSGGAITVIIGIMVVGIAPVAEEFFFRGFFYGALRTRFSFLAAAALDGVLFGAIHAPTGIEAVPPLIALGFAFCVAYEATGSILPCVVLHTLNNMIAFGVDKDGSWPVSGAVAAVVIAACIAVPALNRPRRVVT